MKSSSDIRTRRATLEDASSIAKIYNAGIRSRIATFESRERTVADIAQWFDKDVSIGLIYPVVVAVDAAEDTILGFAAASSYRSRACYHFIAEYSVYVSPDHKRKRIGSVLIAELRAACIRLGIGKLVSRIFAENEAGRGLAKKCGFREVGTYEKHGKRDDDGIWRDCVVVEKILYPYWEDETKKTTFLESALEVSAWSDGITLELIHLVLRLEKDSPSITIVLPFM
jgi:phosphinothricin acetyltransferase